MWAGKAAKSSREMLPKGWKIVCRCLPMFTHGRSLRCETPLWLKFISMSYIPYKVAWQHCGIIAHIYASIHIVYKYNSIGWNNKDPNLRSREISVILILHGALVTDAMELLSSSGWTRLEDVACWHAIWRLTQQFTHTAEHCIWHGLQNRSNNSQPWGSALSRKALLYTVDRSAAQGHT